MSVVNKMLQDLEARSAEGNVVQANYTPSQSPRVTLVTMAVAIVILVAAIIGFVLLDGQAHVADGNVPASGLSTRDTVPAQQAGMAVPTPHIDMSAPAPTQPDNPIAESDTTPAEAEPAQDAVVMARAPVVDTQVAKSEPLQVEKNSQPDASEGTDSEAKVLSEPSQTFTKSSGTRSTQSGSLKERARLALRSGSQIEAIGLLQELLSQQPDDPDTRKHLASALFSSGQPEKAENVLLEGLRQHTDSVTIRGMLARLYFSQTHLRQAFDVLAVLDVQHHDIPADVLALRATLAQQLSLHKQAEQDYRALLSKQPDNAQWWLGYGVVNERLQKFSEALASYQKVKELGPLTEDVMVFVDTRVRALTEVD